MCLHHGMSSMFKNISPKILDCTVYMCLLQFKYYFPFVCGNLEDNWSTLKN